MGVSGFRSVARSGPGRPAHPGQPVGSAFPEKRLTLADRRKREEAGFGHFRRATQTPFNLVFEARA